MKFTLKSFLTGGLLMIFLSGAALADTKIGTVDLRKLFDNYWKTKAAQAAIQERAAQLDKDDKAMKDDLKKGSDDYQKLLSQINDPVISNEERDRRKLTAEEKLKQLQGSKTAIEQFERQAQSTLGEQRQRMRDNILGEIKTAVNAKAKLENFALVLDSAAETVNGTLAVVYNNGQNDITETILSQLNAGTPIDVTKPAPSAP
jgi:outer membrane protein